MFFVCNHHMELLKEILSNVNVKLSVETNPKKNNPVTNNYYEKPNHSNYRGKNTRGDSRGNYRGRGNNNRNISHNYDNHHKYRENPNTYSGNIRDADKFSPFTERAERSSNRLSEFEVPKLEMKKDYTSHKVYTDSNLSKFNEFLK